MRLPFTLRYGAEVVLIVVCALLAGCMPIPITAVSSPRVSKISAPRAAEASVAEYGCGGILEAQTWTLWDGQGRKLLKDQLVQMRLLQAGDTYALYDIQIYFHNIEAMAERCQRTDRLVQLADDLMPLFAAQQPLPGKPDERGWVCRGGAVCNARNKLVNTEVMLASVQGLGLMSALGAALARSPDAQARTHPFIRQSVQASVAHLLRWGGAKARQDWMRMANARAQDVKDGESALFFTDKPLWQIAIYANLGGIAVAQSKLLDGLDLVRIAQPELAQNLKALLAFFRARTSLRTMDSPRVGRVTVADLDRGYWRLYADNRYAGYTGVAPPAVCEKDVNGMRAQLRVDAKKIAPVPDLGWDISHARRLVQVLDAVELNRSALQTWYSLVPAELPASDLSRDFAAQLVTTVWNGDMRHPLFSNYWSGANGWYRVAYDDGTAGCRAGIGPYGLSSSFATGGYATWARYYPLIGELARTVYAASLSADRTDRAYVDKYLPGLSASASASNRMLNQLMFWPSLVQ